MSATSAEIIGQSPLFKHLDEGWKQRLGEAAEVRDFREGDTIIKEGNPVASLYLVVSGRVRVWTETGGRVVELRTLSAGSYFGEVSLLSAKSATASIEAIGGGASLLAIARGVLLELVDQDATLRHMLEGATLARAKDTLGKVLK